MENKFRQNNQNIHINYINEQKILELENRNKKLNTRLKLYKSNLIKVIAISIAASALLSGTIGYNLGKNQEQSAIVSEVTLPSDYIMIDLDVTVNPNDTVYKIASSYYNDNYSSVYGNLDSYVQAIVKKNNIKDAKIYPRDNLSIPVIFNKNNEYYLETNYLQYQINEINENNYWVPHTVDYRVSTIDALAAKASGSESETIQLRKKIMAHNSLESDMIKVGQKLEIVNPELGPLKISLNEAKENLSDSIKNIDIKNQDNIQK